MRRMGLGVSRETVAPSLKRWPASALRAPSPNCEGKRAEAHNFYRLLLPQVLGKVARLLGRDGWGGEEFSF